jgi:hypothetical protein
MAASFRQVAFTHETLPLISVPRLRRAPTMLRAGFLGGSEGDLVVSIAGGFTHSAATRDGAVRAGLTACGQHSRQGQAKHYAASDKLIDTRRSCSLMSAEIACV